MDLKCISSDNHFSFLLVKYLSLYHLPRLQPGTSILSEAFRVFNIIYQEGAAAAAGGRHGRPFLLRRASMTDTAGSRLLGTPGGPMNTPGGGGAGGPGAGGGVGRTGWGRGRGVVGPTGRGVGGAGHLSQYHRFLQRRLHSCTGSGLQVVVGVLPQEVR